MKRSPLRRGKPLRRGGAPLKRSKPLARGKGPTRKRAARWRPSAAQRAAWEARRQECLERDGHRCRRCGGRGTDAAHVVPLGRGRSRYREHPLNALVNLVTLCRRCHDLHDRARAWTWEEIGVVPIPALGAGLWPVWKPCLCCDDFWCQAHKAHAFECSCPPIESWGDVDPYAAR